MAQISQVEVGGTTYDVGVSSGAEYIRGTWTAATNAWTGVTKDQALYDGKEILLFLPFAGTSSATTLNLTLNGGASGAGTTGAKAVYFNSTTRHTTHYGQYQMVRMTYHSSHNIGGTNYEGWWMDYARDTNSDTYWQVRYNGAIKAETAITAANVIVGTKNGYKNVAANGTFDLSYKILYAGSAISAGSTNTNTYEMHHNVNLATTKSGWTGTTYSEVYLVLSSISGVTATIDSTVFTTTVPTTNDGKYYIPIGIMISTTNCIFHPQDRIMAYSNGCFHEYDSDPMDVQFGVRTNVVPSTTLTFAKDGSNDWYATSNNPISGFTNANFLLNTLYKVTWDGTEYDLYYASQFTFNGDTIVTNPNYYEWKAIGSTSTLGNANAYKTNAPFCIAYNYKDASEVQIFAFDSTATSHTIKIDIIPFQAIDVPWAYLESNEKTPFVRRGSAGDFTIVVGAAKDATRNYAFAEGISTLASGTASHAEGDRTTASGGLSHAEGSATTASGVGSHAEGVRNVASGQASHIEGQNNTVSGAFAHVEGYYATSSGLASHVEGYRNVATKNMAHVEGMTNFANAVASHVEGIGNELAESQSVANVSGVYSLSSTTQGKTISVQEKNSDGTPSRTPYNFTLGQYAVIVGNGNSDTDRSNAYTLDWDGNAVYSGKITVGSGPVNNMDVATKKYVDDNHTTNTDSKVSQSDTTTSDWRKIVVGNQHNATAGTTVSAVTDVVYVNKDLEYQPSTGTIRTKGITVSSTGGFNYSGIDTATTNADRNVWYSDAGYVGKPVKSDNFKFNPVSGNLKVTQINGVTVGTPKFTDTTYSAGTGLTLSGTTFNHSNSITAQNTQAIYPIKIDAQGHISAYGSAVTPLTSHQTIKQDGVTGATANRFGTCSTAAGTAAKEVSITTGTFNLETGARVTVKFANANTANSPTLNVNSKGAKNIFHKGAQITSGGNKALLAGTVDFVYDGTQWHLIGNYIDTDNNTDTKVTQTNTTASANYRLLFSETADDTTRTETSRKSTNFYANPSTGQLRATSYNVADHVTLQYNSTLSCLDFVFS